MISRDEFFDNRDVAKWDDFGNAQIRDYSIGSHVDLELDAKYFYSLLDELKNRDKTVVDFGCSTSLYRDCFSGFNYIGIDQNAISIEHAIKRRPKDTFYVSQLNSITETYPELENVADVGYFRTVLQHNHVEEAREILLQSRKVIKPGGLLLLTETTYNDFCCPSEHKEKYNIPHFSFDFLDSVNEGGAIFTAVGWTRELKASGFEVFFHDATNCYAAINRKPRILDYVPPYC